MLVHLRWFVTASLLLVPSVLLNPVGPAITWAGEKGDMVDNPYFTFWAGSKKGATAVHLEKTKMGGPASSQVPGGVDEKRISYKLIDADAKRVIVEAVATEKEFFGYVQSAPTRHIYPAKISKAVLDRFLNETGAKFGEDMVKVKGAEMKVKTVAGTIKGAGDETVEYKLWLSDDVPGSIVKQVRTTRQKGELVAETTTTLESFTKGK